MSESPWDHSMLLGMAPRQFSRAWQTCRSDGWEDTDDDQPKVATTGSKRKVTPWQGWSLLCMLPRSVGRQQWQGISANRRHPGPSGILMGTQHQQGSAKKEQRLELTYMT